MGWKCYTKDSVSYAAMTDETSALACRIEWAMDTPATVTVQVNDDSGGKTQTYSSGYLGTSALLIEQPTATEIFRGRITGVEPNPRDGILTLYGEDWLGQLTGRRITYDTRENLGNGYREAIPEPDWANGQIFWDGAGPLYYMDFRDAQVGAWAADQFNGMRLFFPSAKQLGPLTERMWAHDETIGSSAAPLTTDTPANGETNTWEADGSYHRISDTVGAGGYIYVDYSFRSSADASALVDSLDAITVHVQLMAYGAGSTKITPEIYNATMAQWEILQQDMNANPHAEFHVYDLKVAGPTFSQYFDASNILQVRLYQYSTAGGVLTLDTDHIYVDLTYTMDTVHTDGHTINDTNHVAGTPPINRLIVADSLVSDGLINGLPFSITQAVTVYVANLVTTYDELYALNASADVTASTNYVGRHYHYQTPLHILRDLAGVDGTQFWLDPWDGDSLDLHWNDAFAGAAVATWQDSSVLYWAPAGYRLKDVINEAFVEGTTHGEYKVSGTYSDAASITAYGQRAAYTQNSDIYRNDEATDEATHQVTRAKDPRLQLVACLNGYSTVKLGDIITVNSAKYNINTDYVVARKVWDTAPATTTFDLTPKAALLNVRPPIGQFLQRLDDRITKVETTLERGARYTEVWA